LKPSISAAVVLSIMASRIEQSPDIPKVKSTAKTRLAGGGLMRNN
jgi:hypothetical protein